MIQRQPQWRASRRRARPQQQRHLPMVILNAVSPFGMNGPFQTSRTMAAIAGMAFMAIHDNQGNTTMIRQSPVAL